MYNHLEKLPYSLLGTGLGATLFGPLFGTSWTIYGYPGIQVIGVVLIGVSAVLLYALRKSSPTKISSK